MSHRVDFEALVEEAVDRFKAEHSDLVQRAQEDPKFAAAWERAVRFRAENEARQPVARARQARDVRAPARRTASPEERERRRLTRISRLRDEEAREAHAFLVEREVERATREAEDRLIALEVVASRARADLRRDGQLEAGRRRETRLARAAEHMPREAGPEREAAFRRFVIEDAERRAGEADARERQRARRQSG